MEILTDPKRIFIIGASLIVAGEAPKPDPPLLERPLSDSGALDITVTYTVRDNQLVQTGVQIGDPTPDGEQLQAIRHAVEHLGPTSAYQAIRAMFGLPEAHKDLR